MARNHGPIPRTALGALAAAAAVVVSALTSIPAGAESGAAPAPDDLSACTLKGSASASSNHEWSSCYLVSATLSSAPAIGQTATLDWSVTSAVPRPAATITIEVPDGFEIASPQGGFATTSATQSDGRGDAVLAARSVDLVAGQTVTGSVPVRAVGSGLQELRVSVAAPVAWGVDAAADSAFVTIGAAGASSRMGGDDQTVGGVTSAPAYAAPAPPAQTHTPAADPEIAPSSDDPATDGEGATSCVSGKWSYYDNDGDLQPSINYGVAVWDDDSSTEDDLLASALTNWSGEYNLCFDGADGEGGGQEVYVLFTSSNSTWRVRNTAASDDNYVNHTSTVAICDGCSHNFGSLVPANDIDRGMHAFDSANDMWNWFAGSHSCWDRDSACRRAIINWTPTSSDGTYYSLGSNDVHLAAADPDAPHTVVHEMTHSTMDDAFDDDYPPIPNCSPHYIQNDSSQGCAWTEGFAEWVPAEVYNDPYYRWPSGSELNLETPTWGTSGWDTGDDVEGRVAGSLIDITDAANDAYWDKWDETDPGPVWDTFQSYVMDTFPVFVYARGIDGYDVSNGGGGSSIYQNTIDYSFRNPLSPNVSETYRSPTPNQHNYSQSVTATDWSVTAMRPPTGANYTLSLYDDVGMGTLLKTSGQGTGIVDFIAIDSNHRATQSDYPRVSYSSGTGEYVIEQGANGGALSMGTTSIFMGSTDVVTARDVALSSGTQVAIRVVPAAGQDVDVFLMDSDPATSTTWIRARSEAVASSTGAGAGAAERILYTPGTADTFGLVIVNKSGSGTVNVHADTSAPTGSVTIEGGADRTRDRDVVIGLSASDSQTGIDGMRVSVDGTLDSEPWIAYDGTFNVTLPAGDGTKTVKAEVRNKAYQVSSQFSDTIVLDTRPDLTTKSINKPPKKVEQGAKFTIKDTVKNIGSTSAPASTTRFYLSKDKKFSSGDDRFNQTRAVGSLGAGKSSKGSTKVTVAGGQDTGSYYVLACADDTESVDEFSEANNCKASKKKVKIIAAAPLVPGALR